MGSYMSKRWCGCRTSDEIKKKRKAQLRFFLLIYVLRQKKNERVNARFPFPVSRFFFGGHII